MLDVCLGTTAPIRRIEVQLSVIDPNPYQPAEIILPQKLFLEIAKNGETLR